ncbi:phosphotransferase [Vibrio agarivorans]
MQLFFAVNLAITRHQVMRMNRNQNPAVDVNLKALASRLETTFVEASPLSGGLTNRCWKLKDSSDNQYVWRPNSLILDVFGLTRKQEFQVLKLLDEVSWAPKAIDCTSRGLLVSWLEGEVTDSNSTVRVNQLVDLLSTIHKTKLPQGHKLASFDYEQRIEHYWQQLDPKYHSQALRELNLKYQHQPVLPVVEPALCHLDFGVHNIVQAQEGLKVIDWEYAAIADPRLDLAMALDMVGEVSYSVVERYLSNRGLTRSEMQSYHCGVQAWLNHSRYMAILWYLLAHQHYQQPLYRDSALALIAQLTA